MKPIAKCYVRLVIEKRAGINHNSQESNPVYTDGIFLFHFCFKTFFKKYQKVLQSNKISNKLHNTKYSIKTLVKIIFVIYN